MRLTDRWIGGVATGLILALGWAAPALGAPGDPPPAPLDPPAGATVQANPRGIEVRYQCPVYIKSAPEVAGLVPQGFAEDYTVLVATDPAVAADGQLASPFLRTRALTLGQHPSDDLCSAAVYSADGQKPQTTPGTYYWQVVRTCLVCPSGVEASAVSSFTVGYQVSLKLAVQSRAYVGYPFVARLTVTEPQSELTLGFERRVGNDWRAVTAGQTQGPFDGVTSATLRLPRGTHQLRATASVAGQRFTSAVSTVRVLPARTWTTRRSGGAYREAGNSSLRVRIASGGRVISSFHDLVTGNCPYFVPSPLPGVSPELRFNPMPLDIDFARVRIAPDGRFVHAGRRGSQTFWLEGRVSGRRVRGTADIAYQDCTGGAKFDAVRR